MNLWKFRHRQLFLTQLLLGLLVGAVVSECGAATDYYVSTTGNDSNPGTLAQPWRTIGKATVSIGAGDTCYIRGGTYAERVTVSSRHGQAALPMTFTSYPGETAIIDQNGVTPPNGTSALLTIVNSDYIIIKNLELQNLKSTSASKDMFGIYIHGACNGLQIRNNKVHDIWQQTTATNGNAHGIAAYGDNATAINNLVLDGNEVHHCLLGSSETVALNGNVTNFTVTNNLIHDCNNIGIDIIGFEGTYSGSSSLDRARNGVVAANTVYNITSAYNPSYGGDPVNGGGDTSADGIYVDGGLDSVIERNHVHHCDIGVELASEASAGSCTGIILRNNLIRHNYVTGLSMGGYASGHGSGGTSGCTISNNTLYQNDTSVSWSGQINLQWYVSSNTFTNNIIWANGSTKQMVVNDSAPLGTGNSFNFNLYYSSPGSSTNLEFDLNGSTYTTLASWRSATGWDAQSPFANPSFSTSAPGTSAVIADFALTSGSAAVNAGNPAFVAASGERDIGGQSRVASSRVDIGADEYMTYAQAWRDLYFALPDGGTGANPGDDPDNDGFKNAMEYALGGNPTVSSSSIAPVVGQSGGHLTLSFNRNLSVTDVTFTVQASTNLTSWSTIASKVGTASWSVTSGVTVSDLGNGPVTVTDSATIAVGTNRFLRLSITQ